MDAEYPQFTTHLDVIDQTQTEKSCAAVPSQQALSDLIDTASKYCCNHGVNCMWSVETLLGPTLRPSL